MPRHGANETQLRELTALAAKAEEAAALAALTGAPEDVANLTEARQRKTRERMTEVMAMRMAGLTYRQIGDRIGVAVKEVHLIIHRAIEEIPKVTIEDMRELENARLDAAQTAIWDRVVMGDDKAIEMFLKISTRRASLNGLNEAMKIDLSVSVRQEMEAALAELQHVVLGEVVSRADDTG